MPMKTIFTISFFFMLCSVSSLLTETNTQGWRFDSIDDAVLYQNNSVVGEFPVMEQGD
jgi:hypothetical protein